MYSSKKFAQHKTKKCKMRRVLQTLLIVPKTILKLTICKILWIGVASIIIIFIWKWQYKGIDKEEYSHNINPVILWWTPGFPGSSKTVNCHDGIKCDLYSDVIIREVKNVEAYLFYASEINFDNLPLPRKKDVIWGLFHEESPRNVEELMHELTLSLFNYSATFSRYSDIPFPLQYLESLNDITSIKYFVPTKTKNNLLKEIAPVLYLQSDCETTTERDAYVKELMNFIDVDSFGTCLKNKELPKQFTEDYLNNLNDEHFLQYVARYKFVLAIENGVCEDYVTEKFWRAIKVGSVPIYFGSPLIRDWSPNNKSVILLEDYPTPKKMGDYIKTLTKNDTLYEQYLSHKTKSEITNKRLINEFNTRKYQADGLEVINKFECLICKKLHDRRQGIKEIRIVNKKHYNCPKPISALTLQVNPLNDWVYSWGAAKKRSEDIYKKIVGY